LLDVKKPLPIGNTYFMVKLYSGDGELVAIGKGGGRDTESPVYTCGSGWPGASGDDVSSVEVVAGPVWIVVGVDMTGDATPSRTYMWIDPDPSAEPDTNIAIVKRNTSMPDGFDAIALEFGGDGADVRPVNNNIVPAEYTLSQNYPNPFNPTTKIDYTVPNTGFVTLKVYNILGQEVTILFTGEQVAGNYVATFDGTDLTSGVYVYRLTAGKMSISKKFVLMK